MWYCSMTTVSCVCTASGQVEEAPVIARVDAESLTYPGLIIEYIPDLPLDL